MTTLGKEQNLAVNLGIDGVGSRLGPDRQLGNLAKLTVSPEAIRAVSVDFAKRHRILPFEIKAGVLHLATSDPGNERVIDDIRLITGLEVLEFEAPVGEILEKISECYQVTVEKMIEDLSPEQSINGDSKNLHDIEVMANEPTVVNMVNVIISAALRERASDIHLLPFESVLQLRYRIDGLLQEKPPPPKPLHAALVSRIKIMADMNIAERFLPQDGHIQINHRGARVDIRVGTMPTIYGESVVMRLLEKTTKLLRPRELGLDEARATQMEHLVGKPHGLFLTTGPTGSGKTTTLYSILQGIYAPEKKIITIEDPVEYELAGVAQIPVRPTRGFTFATGLRAILRQDPDVIMVGEIRDSETAEIAIRAALTGHQVFSTLHTNDAAGAVTRLTDMGVEPFLISSSLEGVLAQRLVRKVCPHCRMEWPVPDTVRIKIEALGGRRLEGTYYQGAGCEECRGVGYRGRIGIFELLVVTPDIRELILQRRSSLEIKNVAVKNMITMHQDAFRKAAEGLTTLEEIVRVCSGDAQE
ncbi:MAG TPA: GspE/PulE family protein [Candidatus Limnocylindria bacterium]|jgi:type II secretory ATPase GspE/PulE/Tfp pilus assembly ATPase PilB-like protein|nr:GspE/PulE family protein [Candidatus Limnocylindria bacterium]